MPIIIAKYLPMNSYDRYNKQMFETLVKILESGRFTVTSTCQMIMTSLISFAQCEEERAILLNWFNAKDCDASAPSGKVIGQLTLK